MYKQFMRAIVLIFITISIVMCVGCRDDKQDQADKAFRAELQAVMEDLDSVDKVVILGNPGLRVIQKRNNRMLAALTNNDDTGDLQTLISEMKLAMANAKIAAVGISPSIRLQFHPSGQKWAYEFRFEPSTRYLDGVVRVPWPSDMTVKGEYSVIDTPVRSSFHCKAAKRFSKIILENIPADVRDQLDF
ncbi:MAG: hypothetical protein ACYC27_07195 [Armatimonadota bacterium]